MALDDNIKQEIIREIENTKFGTITIELNEIAESIDVITERRKRFYKKKPKIYDVNNVKHEG